MPHMGRSSRTESTRQSLFLTEWNLCGLRCTRCQRKTLLREVRAALDLDSDQELRPHVLRSPDIFYPCQFSRGSPKKKRAITPGPVWEPMTLPT